MSLIASEFVPRILSAFSLIDFTYAVQIFFIVQCTTHSTLALFFLVSGLAVVIVAYRGHQLQGGRRVPFVQNRIARFLVVDSLLLFFVAGYSAILFNADLFYPQVWFPQNFVLAIVYTMISSSQIFVFAAWKWCPSCARRKRESLAATASNSEAEEFAQLSCCGRREISWSHMSLFRFTRMTSGTSASGLFVPESIEEQFQATQTAIAGI